MENKKFWLEMLAITLVFGMMVVGCEAANPGKEHDDYGPSKVVITNETAFKIDKVFVFIFTNTDDPFGTSTELLSDSSGIEAKKQKTYNLGSRSEEDKVRYYVKVIVTIGFSEEEVIGPRTYIYGLETMGLLLSGTNKDTLKLDFAQITKE
jgi:hypothetical protein